MNQKSYAPFQGMCANPFVEMFQSIAGSLDAGAVSGQPLMKAMARANMEWMGLASRRGQAYLEIPGRVAQCRTPHDLASEQARFWQTCFQQYAETTQRVMGIWSEATPRLPMSPSAADERPDRRDYISFPETRQPAAQGDQSRPAQVAREAAGGRHRPVAAE